MDLETLHERVDTNDQYRLLKVVWDATSMMWLIRTREAERYLAATGERSCNFTPDRTKALRFGSEADASVAMRGLLNAVGN